MVVTVINGIESLRQLGLLGKAHFKAAKSLTAWEYLQQVKATAKTLKYFVVVLGNTLEENKVRLLLKVSQW